MTGLCVNCGHDERGHAMSGDCMECECRAFAIDEPARPRDVLNDATLIIAHAAAAAITCKLDALLIIGPEERAAALRFIAEKLCASAERLER